MNIPPEKVFTDPSSIADAYNKNVSTEFREGATYADTADLPLLNAFFDHLPQGARVLDVGVGPAASFSLTAAERGFNVSMQDGSPQVLESAVNSFAVADLPLADARVGVLPEIPFGDGAFDAAMCIHVLHHLESRDVDASVQGMSRVLGASGYLAIIMLTSPDSETHQEPYEIGDGEFVQRNFHPKEQLHTAFAEAGLEVVGEESVMDPEDTKEVPMPVSTFILRKSSPSEENTHAPWDAFTHPDTLLENVEYDTGRDEAELASPF